MSTMGDIIKRLRIERGMTQEELALAVGYSHKSSINKIEQGKSDISQPKIAMIAKALGVTPDYLFYGKSQKEKEFEELSNLLSDEERKELMDYMRFIISKRK